MTVCWVRILRSMKLLKVPRHIFGSKYNSLKRYFEEILACIYIKLNLRIMNLYK